jgi:hypothetical protein
MSTSINNSDDSINFFKATINAAFYSTIITTLSKAYICSDDAAIFAAFIYPHNATISKLYSSFIID